MDLRRLRAGEWIAAVSGAALIVSLFLPWYSFAGVVARDDRGVAWARIRGVSTDWTGWDALAVNDVILALVGASAVLLLAVTAWQATAALPLALSGLLTLFGLVAVVLVLVGVVWLPDLADTREAGVWLALAGSLGVLAGAWLAMGDERLPAADRPDVEAMPAPRS
jgi:hypothetical protein